MGLGSKSPAWISLSARPPLAKLVHSDYKNRVHRVAWDGMQYAIKVASVVGSDFSSGSSAPPSGPRKLSIRLGEVYII